MTWLEFVLFGMAAFRLTRLIVFDQITDWMRRPFMDKVEEINSEGETEVYFLPKESGLRGWLGALLSCYWCTGIWVTAGMFLARTYTPLLYKPMVIIFAAAGLAALIETWVQSKNIG
ncbi:DUF1360 domain-containing protein [Siminovitchia sediminis]|uniref:DUF1360 domain-containing protein n=1 Tax=Siminovitchia sediminis TaxID=1274353 RepID=A0ABW4KHK1_9BACI